MTALCAWWNIPCKIGEAISNAIHDVIAWVFGHTIGWLIEQMCKIILSLITKAVSAILETVGTLWVKVPSPDLTQGGAVAFMHDQLNPLVLLLVTVSVLIAGIRIVWTREGQELRELIRSLLTTIVFTGLALTVLRLLVAAGDDFSDWIIKRSLGRGSLENTMHNLVKFSGDDTDSFSTSCLDKHGHVQPPQNCDHPFSYSAGLFWVALAVLIGITAVVLAFVQLCLMCVRAAGLIIVAVTIPLAASATNTEFGRHWFRRMVGYLTMFVLYKPAAAIVYATAIRLAQSTKADSSSTVLLDTITGVTMMLLAVVLMPALSRLVVPGSSRA